MVGMFVLFGIAAAGFGFFVGVGVCAWFGFGEESTELQAH